MTNFNRRNFLKMCAAGAAGELLMSRYAQAGMLGLPLGKIGLRLRAKDRGPNNIPIWGISEWHVWYGDYRIPIPDNKIDTVVDDCVDAHLAVGIDHIVWDIGRAAIEYWSDLENTTRFAELGDLTGGNDWSFVRKVMDRYCPLRRAVEYCHRRGAPIIGRLSMNRYYGSQSYIAASSRFAMDNPGLHERSRSNVSQPGKMCYATAEVRQERTDILLEVQRIGVDGLLLDYCRQMPVLLYHDDLVNPYIALGNSNPRGYTSSDPAYYADWFQYRADVLTTQFMQPLRTAVRQQEQQLGRPCPIIARIPDSAKWLMIAYGLDVERWLAEDLIDGTMLSPFPRTIDDPNLYTEEHIALAQRYGKMCIGGIGSKGLQSFDGGPQFTNTGFYDPKPVFELADKQYKAGVDAISIYQTESLARMEYLKDMFKEIGDKRLVARRAATLPEPGPGAEPWMAMDWHTYVVHSVDPAKATGGYVL